jgi:hypothetical protein
VSQHKLYVITREDLGLSYQTPQAIHGVVQFALEHPEEFKAWSSGSNTVVVLNVKDLTELECFSSLVAGMKLKHSSFREPDIGNELTSIVLSPCRKAKRVCSGLKLAGK